MALEKCRECSREVSSEALACPQCGAPVAVAPVSAPRPPPTTPLETTGRAILWVGAIGLVGWWLVSAAGTPQSSDISSPSAAAEPAMQLEVTSWNCSKESGFMKVAGEVTNISGLPIKNVAAVASYYTKDGTFVTSDEALIDYNPILPGQTSPFSTLTRNNPAISTCNVAFKDLLGGSLLWRTAKSTADKRKDLVADIQAVLKSLGYYGGAPDGRDGPGTTSAISKFTAAHGGGSTINADLLLRLNRVVADQARAAVTPGR